MPQHKVELRTYFRILSCALVGGGYLSAGIVYLVLYTNPHVLATARTMAALTLYIGPAYTVATTAAFALLASMLQPFLIRPLARRLFDPVTISWLLLCDLAALAVAYGLNSTHVRYLISPRQQSHLQRAVMGLTVAFGLALTFHAFQRLYPARRRLARIALLAVAVAAIYFLDFQRKASHTPVRRHRLVLDVAASRVPITLVAIDGLTLDHLRPLDAAGRLPNFGRLLREGAVARLKTIQPTDSALAWTTLATGKLPFRHLVADEYVFVFPGIDESFRVTPRYVLFRQLTYLGLLTARPVLRSDRESLAFWNVFTRAGLTVGIVNWPVTYPAERLRGFMVSDYLVKPYFQHGRGLSQVTHPHRLEPLALRHRVMPEDISEELLGTVIPPPAAGEERLPDEDRLRFMVRRARSRDLTTRAEGLIFSSSLSPDVLALRFEGLEITLRYFLKYHAPEAFGDVTPSQKRRLGRVVESQYAFLDGILGELLDSLPAGGMLVVASAYGMQPITPAERLLRIGGDRLANGTRDGGPDGMLILWGRNVQAATALPNQTIADVAPTLLYAEGLPIARDMDGDPVFEAFSDAYKSRTPLSTIQSYEAARFVPPDRPDGGSDSR